MGLEEMVFGNVILAAVSRSAMSFLGEGMVCSREELWTATLCKQREESSRNASSTVMSIVFQHSYKRWMIE